MNIENSHDMRSNRFLTGRRERHRHNEFYRLSQSREKVVSTGIPPHMKNVDTDIPQRFEPTKVVP